MEVEEKKLHIMDYEKKAELLKDKVTLDELDELLLHMRDLADKIDFADQITLLESSKKN